MDDEVFEDMVVHLDEDENGTGSGFPVSKRRDLALGALVGACSGVILGRVGKLSAAALVGGVFLIRVMEQRGYLVFAWDKLSKDHQNTKKRITDSDQNLIQCVKKFATDYKYFLAGMSGGFIVGLALS